MFLHSQTAKGGDRYLTIDLIVSNLLIHQQFTCGRWQTDQNIYPNVVSGKTTFLTGR